MKSILSLLLTLIACKSFAHQDTWYTKQFGNVKVSILTGFQYEEINKVFLFGNLAEQLCKKLNYTRPIFLDYHHFYASDNEPTYRFITYNEIIVLKDANQRLTSENGSIRISQYAPSFNSLTTLKLLEYAIVNENQGKTSQKEISLGYNFKVTTIDTSLIRDVLKTPNSEQLEAILNIRVDRIEEDFKYGTSYYLQNNKYTLFTRAHGSPEKHQIVLDNIFQIEKTDWFDVIVFDADSSFYYINTGFKGKVSNRQIIKNKGDHHQPYKIKYLGGNKVSIYFDSYWKFNNQKERTLIYLINKSILVQDLESLIDP